MMGKNIEWIEKPGFEGFGCSECNWVFNADDSLSGTTLEEMKRNFENRRDKEFASHDCAKHGLRERRNVSKDTGSRGDYAENK